MEIGLLMQLRILLSNSFISMVIFATFLSLALSQIVFVSFVISLFYNEDFMDSHPDIVVNKKSNSPDEDKSAHDSQLLIPTLKDFSKNTH